MSRRKNKRTSYFTGDVIRGRATLSDTVTVIGRKNVPASVDESENLSFLAPKRQRLTKSKLVAIQERDNAKHEAFMKETLSRAQQQELDALRQQVADNDGGIGIGDLDLDSEWIDIEDQDDVRSEDGSEHEAAVLHELGITKKSDTSEWSNRLARENEAWNAQTPVLCEEYMRFCTGMDPPLQEPPPANSQVITLRCISLKSEATLSFTQLDSDSWVNATLLRHGYLAPSPIRPTLAISIDVLDILAAVTRRGPSVSIQLMAKVFCDLRNVPYTEHFRTQLTSALDAYLLIHREVRKRVNSVLGRGPGWILKHGCPACTYKLENELVLRYTMLITCDGNDSLKRCLHSGAADMRTYDSDHYISRSDVDRFQEEVANSRKTTRQKSKAKQQVADEKTECEKRWKNAGADLRPEKKPKKYFDVLRIEWNRIELCDMVQSGERAKYGLATIDKLLSTFGPNSLVGYDIGCIFKGTVSRSSLLGNRARNLNFDMCVGSFHGPAHNRACQVKNHPHNRPGTGLTDFENCETLFSSSNRLATATRLASSFHRHQKIDTYLDGWNDDAYMNLGGLTHRKYMHALQVIESSTDFLAKFSMGETDFRRFFREEEKYLESFKTEPHANLFAIKYVELLERMEAKQLEFNESITNIRVENSGPSDLRRMVLSSQVESHRHRVLDQLMVLQAAVEKLEDSHNILRSDRWVPGTPQWEEAQRLRQNSTFYESLDELERLVVQRVLELSRTGLKGTGYQLRMHIMKSLATRSGAIKSALSRYNKAAAALNPPAPKITWEQIGNATILADCHILRGSRRQITKQPWAKPENRRCVEEYHRLLRAHEEIERLNIEVQRLSTSILDEARVLPEAVKRIAATDPTLALATQRLVDYRLAVNKIILAKLDAVRALPGYSGSNSHEGTVSNSPHQEASGVPGRDASIDEKLLNHEGLEVDDDVARQFDQWQRVLEGATGDTDE